jgi:hypothetical protein
MIFLCESHISRVSHCNISANPLRYTFYNPNSQNWVAKTGQAEQDIRTGQAEKDRQNRTARVGHAEHRTGQAEKDGQKGPQKRTGRTGQAEQDRQNRTVRTGQAVQVRQNRTDRMGQTEQD